MREMNRTLQLKLRDIEVANDDYERQARNTTSSLEDLESKCNVANERAIMLEQEVRLGEQERETLRIETQRLRDELSDLRVEHDIMVEKQTTTKQPLHANPARPRSQISVPPSPPLSITTNFRAPRSQRVPSSGTFTGMTPTANSTLSRSESLVQIKGLLGRMQKIEKRVKSARSKLAIGDAPGPSIVESTEEEMHESPASTIRLPANVTIRSGRVNPVSGPSKDEQMTDQMAVTPSLIVDETTPDQVRQSMLSTRTDGDTAVESSATSTPLQVQRSSAGVASQSVRKSLGTPSKIQNSVVRPRPSMSAASNQSAPKPAPAMAASRRTSGMHTPHTLRPRASMILQPRDVPTTPSGKRAMSDRTSIPTPQSFALRQAQRQSENKVKFNATKTVSSRRISQSLRPSTGADVGETF